MIVEDVQPRRQTFPSSVLSSGTTSLATPLVTHNNGVVTLAART